jgi:hypothetical protein
LVHNSWTLQNLQTIKDPHVSHTDMAMASSLNI